MMRQPSLNTCWRSSFLLTSIVAVYVTCRAEPLASGAAAAAAPPPPRPPRPPPPPPRARRGAAPPPPPPAPPAAGCRRCRRRRATRAATNGRGEQVRALAEVDRPAVS